MFFCKASKIIRNTRTLQHILARDVGSNSPIILIYASKLSCAQNYYGIDPLKSLYCKTDCMPSKPPDKKTDEFDI